LAIAPRYEDQGCFGAAGYSRLVTNRVLTLRPAAVRAGQPAGATIDDTDALRRRFAAIRAEFDVPGQFPAEALREARAAAARPRSLLPDETALPFFTIDPPGSMDLDQAMHLERAGGGYRVRYAIADVPGFVAPGGAVDAEARRRGQTLYLPDGRAPLHPPDLSEAAASLLPGEVRPAYVWDFALDPDAEVTGVSVRRALVRSCERLDYAGVQQALDAGKQDDQLRLLEEIGRKRIELERARGGASLPMPEQEVSPSAEGGYRLAFRPLVECEEWNAQISVMTGMAAAGLMLDGGVGILRTMPPPNPADVERFRRSARGLGVDWPQQQRYGDFLRGLDRTDARHLAVIHEATRLFRGAAYTPLDGSAPQASDHAAVSAPYAHVTAPLRRLVDRFGLVVCAALSSGKPVPDWARAALAALPAEMAASDRRASAVDRACTDAVEAAALAGLVGRRVEGSVVDADRKGRVTVQLTGPAVLASAEGSVVAGQRVSVEVVSADIATGRSVLRIAG
jgi:exoribonuclease R